MVANIKTPIKKSIITNKYSSSRTYDNERSQVQNVTTRNQPEPELRRSPSASASTSRSSRCIAVLNMDSLRTTTLVLAPKSTLLTHQCCCTPICPSRIRSCTTLRNRSSHSSGLRPTRQPIDIAANHLIARDYQYDEDELRDAERVREICSRLGPIEPFEQSITLEQSIQPYDH